MKIRKYILFVGDEDDYYFLHHAVWELNRGIDVKYQSSFFIAIDLLQGIIAKNQSAPQLILIDLDLPGVNQPEVAKNIRLIRELKYIPILLLSNTPEEWDITFWEKQGVTILGKPRRINEYTTIAETIVFSMI